jgi:hypothetical protein
MLLQHTSERPAIEANGRALVPFFLGLLHRVMTPLAERLPVRLIPEECLVTTMRDYVVRDL